MKSKSNNQLSLPGAGRKLSVADITWNTCPPFFYISKIGRYLVKLLIASPILPCNNGRCATRFIAHPPRCGLLWDWNSQSWYSVTPRHRLSSGGAPIQHVLRYNGIGERNRQRVHGCVGAAIGTLLDGVIFHSLNLCCSGCWWFNSRSSIATNQGDGKTKPARKRLPMHGRFS